MSVKTKDPDIRISEPYVAGDLTAADSEATAPRLEPIRQRPAGRPIRGNVVSSRGSSSWVRNLEWAVEFVYSVSRSSGCRKATTVSATSERWMRLSSTVLAAAYWMKSGPSCTTSNGYVDVVRNRAGRYRVTGQSRCSARLGTTISSSVPCRATGSGSVHSGVRYPSAKHTEEVPTGL